LFIKVSLSILADSIVTMTTEVQTQPIEPKTETTEKKKPRLVRKEKKRAPKRDNVSFYLDCSKPVNDGIMDPQMLEEFFSTKIKVGGKVGQLGEVVKVSRDKSVISVSTSAPFSKRYIKYLTKKFLKKHQLRDWLRVIASDKNTYELRYFNIQDIEESGSEDSK